ncbi:NAD-dependent epimerase/dehydratase family protein [Foetidibacter luteolus]|uniref:NAD-dependent epimerase/dehydratase family protein n=1 Tax=Foetidibacter luteolus TaxID=2608880 RepID=UPI001F319057|nr:NAD-dependent epimerase/dehydratase family protein [Foetidibacter luteolus]
MKYQPMNVVRRNDASHNEPKAGHPILHAKNNSNIYAACLPLAPFAKFGFQTKAMIVVTGATGLVGSHLVKELARQGKQVRALYNRTAPAGNMPGIEWVKADILDVVALEEVLADARQVYHCAAIVSFSPKTKHVLQQTNIEGTANVVNASLDAGIEKMVFVSSVAALGRIREGESINETMFWTPETSNSEYGKSKYLAEMEVWRGISEGLNAVIVNPSIILGSGDWSKGSAELFKSAYKEFPWYTNGISGFTDVADVVKAMIMLMESDIHSQRFIINTENISFRELFTAIANSFNKRPPHREVTPLIAEIVWRAEAVKSMFTGKTPMLTKETARTSLTKVYFDNSKLLQYLPGFTYTPLNESIERIAAELKQQYQL